MGVLSQGLVQGFYSMFATHNPQIRAAKYSMEDGPQHSLIGKIERNVNPGIELGVTVQPTGRASVASFPGGNNDEQEQYVPQISDSYEDAILARLRVANQEQQHTSNDVEACIFRTKTQHPTQHPSKYNPMTAGEVHQVNVDDLFSCTFKNVLMDHLVHLLPVYAGEYSPSITP